MYPVTPRNSSEVAGKIARCNRALCRSKSGSLPWCCRYRGGLEVCRKAPVRATPIPTVATGVGVLKYALIHANISGWVPSQPVALWKSISLALEDSARASRGAFRSSRSSIKLNQNWMKFPHHKKEHIKVRNSATFKQYLACGYSLPYRPTRDGCIRRLSTRLVRQETNGKLLEIVSIVKIRDKYGLRDGV